MQGFTTSGPRHIRGDASTIESFRFPMLSMEPPSYPFEKIRVPLLPDNYTPNRSSGSAHAAETLDVPMHRGEISVIAAHPENVTPAAMSEVVGNEGLDVDIGQLIAGFSEHLPKEIMETGALKELWTGIVDDVFGASKQDPKVAV